MSEHKIDTHNNSHDAPELMGGLSTNRVEALSDGVFAVAMTLLVLEVHVPDVRTGPLDPLTFLADLWYANGSGKVFLAYVMSFALLGVYWVGQHSQFQYIRRADRPLLWINILFLLLIALVPFTTSMVGKYMSITSMALVVYGVHLLAIAIVIYSHWWYATHDRHLTDHHLDQQIVKAGAGRIRTSMFICLAGLALAFINPYVSAACYLLIPIYYIVPGRIDRHWSPWRRKNMVGSGANVSVGGEEGER